MATRYQLQGRHLTTVIPTRFFILILPCSLSFPYFISIALHVVND